MLEAVAAAHDRDGSIQSAVLLLLQLLIALFKWILANIPQCRTSEESGEFLKKNLQPVSKKYAADIAVKTLVAALPNDRLQCLTRLLSRTGVG